MRILITKSVLLLAGLLSVVGCVDTRKDAKPSNEFSFDFNNPQQTIHSFGASDCWRGQYLGLNWPLEKRNQMADYLFSTEMDELGNPKGIGLSLWTLSESGLAAGEWGNAGNTSGCNSCTMCATDRSGMLLLPDEISPEIAKKMIGVDTSVQTSDENGEMSGSKSTATGSDIYAAIMERYPNALSKDGKTPANGLMILPFLAAAMQLLSTLVTMKRQKKEGQSQQAKSMNTMMYIMPVISILICMSSTTAFAFYWTISGAFQLISTLVINAIFDKKAKKEVA